MVNQNVLSRNQTKLDLLMPFHSLFLQNSCDKIQGKIIQICLGERNRVKPFLVNMSLFPRTTVLTFYCQQPCDPRVQMCPVWRKSHSVCTKAPGARSQGTPMVRLTPKKGHSLLGAFEVSQEYDKPLN